MSQERRSTNDREAGACHGRGTRDRDVDAVIDLEWTRASRPDAPGDFFLQPSEIAEDIWHVVHQPKGAWSFNVEVRPFKENW
jgi:hypothetical protein